jgi:hypothetical protein
MRRFTFTFIENVPEGARPYLRRDVQAWIDRNDYPVCAFTLPNGSVVDLCRRPWPPDAYEDTVGAERQSDYELLLKFVDERHKWPLPAIADIVADLDDVDKIADLGGRCGSRALAHGFSTFAAIVVWVFFVPEFLFAMFVPAYWLWSRCQDMRACIDRIAEVKLAKSGISLREAMARDGYGT